MEKSTHSPHYSAVREKLLELRKQAGLTHRQLAERLGREHSFVWRVEQGERRLDLVEFHWYCAALGCDGKAIYGLLAERFEEADRRNPGATKKR